MKLNRNQKDLLTSIIIIFLMLGITYIFYFLSGYKKENLKSDQQQEKVLETPEEFEERVLEEQMFLNNANDSMSSIDTEVSTNIFLENSCDFINTGSIKFLDIATPDNRIYTPQDTNQIKTTTKSITISGNIEEAFLCIISDISNRKDSYNAYRKKYSYNTVTKIIFGDDRGALNVGYYKDKKQFYDYDSNNLIKVSKELNGKFRTHEAPFRYIINLNSVILADEINGGYNYYPLINKLKNGNTINIGGYMVKIGKDDYWASSISYYRLIWKGDGTINSNK